MRFAADWDCEWIAFSSSLAAARSRLSCCCCNTPVLTDGIGDGFRYAEGRPPWSTYQIAQWPVSVGPSKHRTGLHRTAPDPIIHQNDSIGPQNKGMSLPCLCIPRVDQVSFHWWVQTHNSALTPCPADGWNIQHSSYRTGPQPLPPQKNDPKLILGVQCIRFWGLWGPVR